MNDQTKMRIDKWLWAARFYKTRSAAATAVTGGKVHLNGQRVKPAHLIKANDKLSLSKGIYEIIITVQGLSERRGPAKEAQLLYEETSDSVAKREKMSELNRMSMQYLNASPKRPDKRARREIMKLRKS